MNKESVLGHHERLPTVVARIPEEVGLGGISHILGQGPCSSGLAAADEHVDSSWGSLKVGVVPSPCYPVADLDQLRAGSGSGCDHDHLSRGILGIELGASAISGGLAGGC